VALGAAVGLAVVYLIFRALARPLQYYDAFAYLMNAQWLAGNRSLDWDGLRPPLLSFLLLPVVALARLGDPANAWLIRGPALVNITITVATLWVMFAFFRRSLGATWALVGVALFALSRATVRYGGLIMTDLPVMGLMLAAFHVYVIAFERRRLWTFVAAGALTGAALLMKFTAGILAPAIVLVHALLSFDTRRLEGHRWFRFALDLRRLVGLVLAGVVAAAVFAAVMTFVFRLVYGAQAWAMFDAKIIKFAPKGAEPLPGEAWTDYLQMMWVMLSPPVLVLSALGLAVALAWPRRRDLPALAWMLVVGFGLMIKLQHTEIRYAFPVIPGVIYFAVRALEAATSLAARFPRASRSLALVAAAPIAALIAFAGWNGAAQAVADNEAVFGMDLQRRGPAELLAARNGKGRLHIMGKWHTISPKHPGPLPHDEVFNTFHLGPHIPMFFLGEKVDVWLPSRTVNDARAELPAKLGDGDAVLRLDDYFYLGDRFPAQTPRPLEIWSVFRRDLKVAGDRGLLASADGAVKGHLEGAAFVSDTDLGEGFVYLSTGVATYRFLQAGKLPRGGRAPFALAPGEQVAGVTFLRVTTRTLP
jgi:4-amino-4-deoxy-L-arabinose transferase-like glycosyltransferase